MDILWDAADNDEGNVSHLLRHGVTPGEAAEVLYDPRSVTTSSRSSERSVTFGFTLHGRYLAVVWDWEDKNIRPISAYDTPKPRQPRRKRS